MFTEKSIIFDRAKRRSAVFGIAALLSFSVGNTQAADGPAGVSDQDVGLPPGEVLGGGNVDIGRIDDGHQPPALPVPTVSNTGLPADESSAAPDTSSRIAHESAAVIVPEHIEIQSVTLSTLPIPVEGATGQDVIQGDLPVGADGAADAATPAGITGQTSSTPQVGESISEISANVSEFDGINHANSGWRPPDTVVAVGGEYVVEAVNSGFAVYDMEGAVLQSYTTANTFFSAVKPYTTWTSFFDPRIVWDKETGKFVMLYIGRETSTQQSYTFLAVSKTGDPTGDWWLYRITNNSGLSTAWMDYATLGVDKWGIYFSGNLFSWAGSYVQTDLYTLDNSFLTGSNSGGAYRWSDLKWPILNGGGKAFSLQAAHPHTVNGNQETFLVNTAGGTGDKVLLWTLGGKRGPSDTDVTATPSLSKAATNTNQYYSIGNNVDQAGSATDLDGGDTRIMNAIYSNRRVYTTFTSDIGNAATQTGIQTVNINTDTNANVWSKSLQTAGNYYFYPAITLLGTSTTESIGLILNWSSSSRYPSTVYKIYDTPATSNSGDFVAYHLGTGPYVSVFGGRNRFGDYTGAAYDWSCSGRFWGAAEYGTTTLSSWATRLVAVDSNSNTQACPLGRPDVISKTSPSGTISDTTPTFRWTADSNATSYRLYVHKGGAIHNVVYTEAAAGCASDTTCAVTPITLTAGAHNWWVRGENSTFGAGPWGSPMSFTLGSGVPGAATSLQPSGGAYAAGPTVGLQWQAASNATWYYMYLYRQGDSNVRTQWVSAATAGCSSGGTCSYNYPSTYGDTTYWVRTWNSAGYGPWSASARFTATDTRPYLFNPTGAGSGANPTYTFAPVTDATWYQLYVSHGGTTVSQWYTAGAAGCGTAGSHNCSLTNSTSIVGSATWWVRGWEPGLYGPWSAAKGFTP